MQVFKARVFVQRLDTATIRLVRDSEHEAHHAHDHKCASEDHHLHVEIVRNRGGRRLVNDAARADPQSRQNPSWPGAASPQGAGSDELIVEWLDLGL